MIEQRRPVRNVDAAACAQPQLALRLADYARSIGLTVRGIQASRAPTSRSRYLRLCDGLGRSWLVRVASHPERGATGYARPHFDLIARDSEAEQGFVQGRAFLDRVRAGDVTWFDPDDVRQPRRKRR